LPLPLKHPLETLLPVLSSQLLKVLRPEVLV
jgi:hypothetical protein